MLELLFVFAIFTATTALGLYRHEVLFWLMILCLPAYTIRLSIGPVPTTVLELVVLGYLASAGIRALAHRAPSPRLLRRGSLKAANLPSVTRLAESGPRVGGRNDLINFIISTPLRILPLLFLLNALFEAIISPDLRSALGIWKAYFLEPVLVYYVLVNELQNTPPPFDGRGPGEGDELNPFFQPPPLRGEEQSPSIHPPHYQGGGARPRDGVVAFLLPMLALSILSICQYVFNFGLHRGFDDPTRGRVLAVFNTPNAVGLFFAPLIALFFPAFLAAVQNLVRHRTRSTPPPTTNYRLLTTLLLFTIPLSTLALILSFSRGGWLGLAVALAVYLVIRFGRKAIIPLVLCGLIGGLLLFTTVPRFRTFFQSTGNELDLTGDNSTNVRLNLWSRTADMLAEHVPFGAGLSGFQTEYAKRGIPGWEEVTLYPHNLILNFWSETGLLGLLLFLSIVAQAIRLSLKRVRQHKAYSLTPIAYSLLLFLTALLVHGLVDVPYFKNDLSLIFWIILALSAHISSSFTEKAAEDTSLKINRPK